MDAVRRTIWVPPSPPRPVSRAWQLSPGLREVASCVCWLGCVNRHSTPHGTARESAFKWVLSHMRSGVRTRRERSSPVPSKRRPPLGDYSGWKPHCAKRHCDFTRSGAPGLRTRRHAAASNLSVFLR